MWVPYGRGECPRGFFCFKKWPALKNGSKKIRHDPEKFGRLLSWLVEMDVSNFIRGMIIPDIRSFRLFGMKNHP